MAKSTDAFRTIGEVSDELDVPKHVLRFWEGKFPQLKPMKRGGGRRFYRPEDVVLLRGIHKLLHASGYTIKGVQRILREDGVEVVKNAAAEDVVAPAVAAASAKAGTSQARGKRPAPVKVPMADALKSQLAELLRELEACLVLARGTATTAPQAPRSAAGKAKR